MPTNLLVWGDKYKIGLSAIDEQHEELFKIYNKLAVALMERRKNNRYGLEHALQIAVRDAAKFVLHHFRFEEDLMYVKGYPHLKEHKAKHVVFIKKLVDIIKHPERSSFSESYKLLKFFKKWLIEHILYEDAQFVYHLTGKSKTIHKA